MILLCLRFFFFLSVFFTFFSFVPTINTGNASESLAKTRMAGNLEMIRLNGKMLMPYDATIIGKTNGFRAVGGDCYLCFFSSSFFLRIKVNSIKKTAGSVRA